MVHSQDHLVMLVADASVDDGNDDYDDDDD